MHKLHKIIGGLFVQVYKSDFFSKKVLTKRKRWCIIYYVVRDKTKQRQQIL